MLKILQLFGNSMLGHAMLLHWQSQDRHKSLGRLHKQNLAIVMQHEHDNHIWVSDASQNSARLLASRLVLCSDPEQAKSMNNHS